MSLDSMTAVADDQVHEMAAAVHLGQGMEGLVPPDLAAVLAVLWDLAAVPAALSDLALVAGFDNPRCSVELTVVQIHPFHDDLHFQERTTLRVPDLAVGSTRVRHSADFLAGFQHFRQRWPVPLSVGPVEVLETGFGRSKNFDEPDHPACSCEQTF
jgi:hypothetical protein